MASIYNKADIYDLLENQEHLEAYKKHWETLLRGKRIHSFLDISIELKCSDFESCPVGMGKTNGFFD